MTTQTKEPVRLSGRVPIDQQLVAQELTLAEGETALRYRDIVLLYNALVAIGGRHLPTKEARIHVARCLRVLKPDIEDRNSERQRLQAEHAPDPETLTADGGTVTFRDAVGLTRKFDELDAMVAPIKLPSRITDAMLPQNDKAHPNNEDGLANILADLGPLYEIE